MITECVICQTQWEVESLNQHTSCPWCPELLVHYAVPIQKAYARGTKMREEGVNIEEFMPVESLPIDMQPNVNVKKLHILQQAYQMGLYEGG